MTGAKPKARTKPLSVMTTILGECMCAEPFFRVAERGRAPSAQFLTISGIECISLGAVTNESSAKRRVDDTVSQLASRPERLASIGYLIDHEMKGEPIKLADSIPLDVWEKAYPEDKNMARSIRKTIQIIKNADFPSAIKEFDRLFQSQFSHQKRGDNPYFMGMTLHSLAVLYILMGESEKAMPLLRNALEMKEQAFGNEHPEVAITQEELGIQLFAREEFDDALELFQAAKRGTERAYGTDHPKVAMALNNIGCCNFHLGNSLAGLVSFQQARDLQLAAMRSNAKADLDLIHVATTLGNLGYMMIRLKQYEDARAIFEEALLVQQSVLGDDHQACRDTISNIDFTNAFHHE
eukprot:CAMPEP_0118676560 /NCGR_PEP_ID=MMETSP0800-20121206/2118_1 /TAXON_ID=210618 ORGANISM="Striatella unipunctata, Strain CCMP2910" /NCGR_SAMPLE_ID=MMETSP0800 /ASSEMBLY_ACC=CAM_ASM_000638 /LENGTH=351 /DNA_ID=CAMNT_0006572093 /DNA_START=137 /DNA_END=1192 /DNA_ORIENTATION=+